MQAGTIGVFIKGLGLCAQTKAMAQKIFKERAAAVAGGESGGGTPNGRPAWQLGRGIYLLKRPVRKHLGRASGWTRAIVSIIQMHLQNLNLKRRYKLRQPSRHPSKTADLLSEPPSSTASSIPGPWNQAVSHL